MDISGNHSDLMNQNQLFVCFLSFYQADHQNHPYHDNHNHIVAQGRVLLGRAEGGARYYGAGTKKFLLQILFRISIIIVIIYCVECFYCLLSDRFAFSGFISVSTTDLLGEHSSSFDLV